MEGGSISATPPPRRPPRRRNSAASRSALVSHSPKVTRWPPSTYASRSPSAAATASMSCCTVANSPLSPARDPLVTGFHLASMRTSRQKQPRPTSRHTNTAVSIMHNIQIPLWPTGTGTPTASPSGPASAAQLPAGVAGDGRDQQGRIIRERIGPPGNHAVGAHEDEPALVQPGDRRIIDGDDSQRHAGVRAGG